MLELLEMYGIVLLWSLPVSFFLVLLACEVVAMLGAAVLCVAGVRRAVRGLVCRYKVYQARKGRKRC